MKCKFRVSYVYFLFNNTFCARNFDDFIDTKDYSKEEIKKLKEETEISTNIENEEGKY